jgi:pantoate--beta-alanine ligase
MNELAVFHEKTRARQWVHQQRAAGRTVGLVPTMGALHEGHFSLVRRSVRDCDATVATIFVNPTQFAPGEDLAKYPRTLEADLEGLRSAGAAAVFVPPDGTMYSANHSTYVVPPAVARRWEGAARPEHFRGVTTVVLKLFHILPADRAFFGQKDYQQAIVIQTMVRDLDLDIDIAMCPIVRDADGLAMSSRNGYLSTDERQRALSLFRALRRAAELARQGVRDVSRLEAAMHEVLRSGAVDAVDYAAVVDRQSLEPLDTLETPGIALVAARVGATRLIDNMMLTAATDIEVD